MGELIGRITEKHLAWLRRLLEPSRDIHGVADHHLLPRLGVAGNHLPRIDADTRLDRDPALRLKVGVQRNESILHLAGRPDGADGVILVHLWHAEDSHDSIADELLDGPTVTFDHGAHRIEVARHHVPKGLRVVVFAKAC